jgi:hypothetical protein
VRGTSPIVTVSLHLENLFIDGVMLHSRIQSIAIYGTVVALSIDK